MKNKRELMVIIIASVVGFVSGQIGLLNQPLLATTDVIKHKEVITQSLSIVDSMNKKRAAITTMPEGIVGLSLSDVNEKPRCLITVGSTGETAVSFVDGNSKFRCVISSSANGQPLISLNDSKQNIKLGMTLDENNLPSLELYGSDNLQCAEFIVNEYGPKLTMLSPNGSKGVFCISPLGEPGLHLLDKQGVLRSSMLVSQSNSPTLQLFDSTGHQRGGFSIDPDGMTRVGLFDTTRGIMRGVFGMSANGEARLIFVGEDGKALASYP